MKSFIYDLSSEFEMTVAKDKVALFFDAVSWQTGRRPQTPPTLATNFRSGEFEILKQMGIPLEKVLHGEQKYRFIIDLMPETLYKCKTFVSNFHEKTGSKGSLGFYQIQTDINDIHGNLCVECTSTIVVRDAIAKESK